MNEKIRNILDPASKVSDDEALELLQHAQQVQTSVWDMVIFLLRQNLPDHAVTFLRQQGDSRLSQLADVLPRLIAELDQTEEETKPMQVIYNTIDKVNNLNPSATTVNNNFQH